MRASVRTRLHPQQGEIFCSTLYSFADHGFGAVLRLHAVRGQHQQLRTYFILVIFSCTSAELLPMLSSATAWQRTSDIFARQIATQLAAPRALCGLHANSLSCGCGSQLQSVRISGGGYSSSSCGTKSRECKNPTRPPAGQSKIPVNTSSFIFS